MNKLVLFNNSTLNKLLNKRLEESKFGDHVTLLTCISNIYEQLINLDVRYVILGIPEDIGILANHGKKGASKAWEAAIKALLNIQSNTYTKANKVLILGHLDFSVEMLEVSKLDLNKKKGIAAARTLVEVIDKQVTFIVNQIVSAGKIPIIIGGGHNNAYGNIKGTSLALKTAVNVVNFDAYSNFRIEKGRHSGNGFHYAYSEGFLKNYFIFGLHEDYTSQSVFETLDTTEHIAYNTFESIEIRKTLKFKAEMLRALNHVSKAPFGIEIDCNAIENVSSSAMIPVGFSVNKTRTFINHFAKHENAAYLHICEAIPKKKSPELIGKLIAYFITDFIKA